jgi:catechol 2,3-dioxygenase-like lactoylglutathione lyase family enzyme
MPGTIGTMTGIATLAMVSLDCANPARLAEFYHEVLGWEITHSQDDYAMITDANGTNIGFGRLDDYTPPAWPDNDGRKQYHLDLYVDDPAKAITHCLDLGATKPDFQPGSDRWTVLLDPDGHPFCLCPRQQ